MFEKPGLYKLAQRHFEFKQVRERDAVDIWKHADKFYEMLWERDPQMRGIPVGFEYPKDPQNTGRGTNDLGCLYQTEAGMQAVMVLCRDEHNWSNATFFYDSSHDVERSRIIAAEDLVLLEIEITEWFNTIKQELLLSKRNRPYDVETLHYTMELPKLPPELGDCFILKIQGIPIATVVVCRAENGYVVDFFRTGSDVLQPLEKFRSKERSR